MTEQDPSPAAPAAPVAFNFDDYLAQKAEHERREAELLPANKDDRPSSRRRVLGCCRCGISIAAG